MKPSTEPLIRAIEAVPAHPVERAAGVTMQVLVGAAEGAPNFATRRFTLEPGARIPCHRHDSIEHVQVMLEGEMVLGLDQRTAVAVAGDCLLIPAGVAHWYENRGQETASFLCVVPLTDEYQTEWLE